MGFEASDYNVFDESDFTESSYWKIYENQTIDGGVSVAVKAVDQYFVAEVIGQHVGVPITNVKSQLRSIRDVVANASKDIAEIVEYNSRNTFAGPVLRTDNGMSFVHNSDKHEGIVTNCYIGRSVDMTSAKVVVTYEYSEDQSITAGNLGILACQSLIYLLNRQLGL